MMNHNMQMQKETGKILHRKFLSENIGLLLMAPVFLLLMFIVSNLYQLPAEYAFYLTSIFLSAYCRILLFSLQKKIQSRDWCLDLMCPQCKKVLLFL